MIKFTLLVDGVEMTFTQEEIIAIVEEHFDKAKFEQKQEEPIRRLTRPEEGVPYLVNPSEIDWTLFKTERGNVRQESTRKLILEAHTFVDEYPQRYGKPFYTLIPNKTWDNKTVGGLRELATNLGDHMADWVEQALEWAQRITNGETWEDVCNKADTAKWYRLIDWKGSCARLVGGSRIVSNDRPASAVYVCDYNSGYRIGCTVPLVVLYK